MKQETIAKIRACKALAGKAVIDVVALPKFQENLAAYLLSQQEERKAVKASLEAMRRAGGARGYHAPAHVIDKFLKWSAEDFSVAFIEVLYRKSKRPAAERQYIYQLGMQAYALTVSQIVVEEYPELKEELIPTNKNN